MLAGALCGPDAEATTLPADSLERLCQGTLECTMVQGMAQDGKYRCTISMPRSGVDGRCGGPRIEYTQCTSGLSCFFTGPRLADSFGVCGTDRPLMAAGQVCGGTTDPIRCQAGLVCGGVVEAGGLGIGTCQAEAGAGAGTGAGAAANTTLPGTVTDPNPTQTAGDLLRSLLPSVSATAAAAPAKSSASAPAAGMISVTVAAVLLVGTLAGMA